MTKNSTIAAAAIAFALGSTSAFAAEAPSGSTGPAIAAGDAVHCYGVNSCKGQADCATTEHACKGQNECAGQGFKEMTAGECLAADGTIGDIG